MVHGYCYPWLFQEFHSLIAQTKPFYIVGLHMMRRLLATSCLTSIYYIIILD